jgi:hypothetical protein
MTTVATVGGIATTAATTAGTLADMVAITTDDRCIETKPGASAPGFLVPECPCRLVLSAAKPNNGADDAGAFL